MGNIDSNLTVINNTKQDIVSTSAYSCANFDWRGNNRPDRNFQGYKIKAKGGSITQSAVLRKQAKHCPFNMKLTFSDGTVDEFRIHQKHVVGCCAGFNHMRRSHDIVYHTVNRNTLVITVKNTSQQLQNEKAEEKNKEGEALMKQKQHEAAMKKFDEALGLANQAATTNKVKKNKSQACNEFGKACLQQGCDLEADVKQDKSKEAQGKFDQAKRMFQQAISLSNVAEYQKNMNLVNLKIEGNRLFNEANDLEQAAFTLFKNGASDNSVAQNKYKEGLEKYKEAVKKFEAGAKIDPSKFDDSVTIANECVTEVAKVIDNIDQAELNNNVGKMNADEEKKEESKDDQVVDTSFIQQVDGAEN
ncbi:hypothetical protein Zmor_001059 [Zophobas morio]|uniref:Uncharacterized protein n=1 Tax=Zophobas morio TaxID=2755281 RepID=A0AA38J1A6_9CUCU|nr:hypothetical protein Zmor_001059 [Zophobas morio]